jgi:hypothetical protein
MMTRFGKHVSMALAASMLLSGLTILSGNASADLWIPQDLGRPYSGPLGNGLTNVSVGDGDRDGSIEVYFTSGEQDGRVYEYSYNQTTGNWNNISIGIVSSDPQNRARAVIVGDGDDNGLNEVYVSGDHRAGGGGNPPWVNGIYQFVFTGGCWTSSRIITPSQFSFGICLGDGNNDGRKELYSGDSDGHVYQYTKTSGWNNQDMSNPPPYYYRSTLYVPVIRGVALGDGDNDGRNEIYAATNNHYVYRYNWTGLTWDISPVGNGTNDGSYNNYFQGMTRIAVGDVDNDGKNEVYATSYINATVYKFKWNATARVWDPAVAIVTLGASLNALDICIGDGNGDSKNEIYAACSNNQVYQVAYNNGQWTRLSVGSGSGAMNGVDMGSTHGDSFNRVYGACADGHGYEFIDDFVPPSNPTVSSDTHPVPSTWYASNVVHVMWTDVGQDISGIDGYSYIWDNGAGTLPPTAKTCEETVHDDTSSALPDGDSYFHIRACDRALNWNTTAAHFGPIRIDTVAPDSVSVSINGGADYANSNLVTLSLSATDPTPGSGVAYASFSNDGTTWSGWEDFSASRSGWDITGSNYGGTGADGAKNVYVRVMDLVGHEIAQNKRASDSIFLDSVAPGNLSMTINGGALYATTADVSLSLAATDPDPASGLFKRAFSNDGVSFGNWTDWSGSAPWSLTAGAGGTDSDGPKTVYFKVQDRAQNVGGPVTATIFLDRLAPDQLGLMIDSGAAYTNNATASLTVLGSDAGSGLAEMTLANDPTYLGTWESFSSSKEGWSLINGTGGVDNDGNKSVHLKVRDNAGNVGGPISASIFLDRVKPGGLAIVIEGGAGYTNSLTVNLTVRAADQEPSSGLWAMQFSDDGWTWTDWVPYAATGTFTLQSGDGVKTVYFRAKDHAGNVADTVTDTITLDTQPPQIYNVMVVGITDTSAMVVWTTNEEADSGLDYGLTAAYGSSKLDPAFTTAHSLALTGLSPTTAYHLRAYSRDQAGNPPAYTGDIVFNTTAAADTTPPAISNVQVSGVTDKLAVVTWTTSEAADSAVDFGTDTSYGMKASEPGYVLLHTVTLTGLLPLTTYHLRVRSADPSGNGATGADQSFTTSEAPDLTPPVISSVKVGGVTDRLAVVSWETDEPADGTVEFGTDTAYGRTVSHSGLLRLHELTLTGLNASMPYHFRVRSTDGTGNGPSFSVDFNFTTLALPDTQPPVISNIMVQGVTENAATIIWETDELADGKVDYGTSASYGLSSAAAGFARQHSVTLTGLSADTLYHLRVVSADPSANSASGGDLTFRTKKTGGGQDTIPPVITNIQISGITDTMAVIIWDTDEPASSEVEYGNTTAYGLRSSDTIAVTVHSVILSGLSPNSTYHLRVKSTDTSGNGPTVSADLNFTTVAVPDVAAPIISGIHVVEVTSDGATIQWMTDEPANAFLEYGAGASYVSNIASGIQVLNHTLRITGLKPGTIYHYRIISTDASGNPSQPSADATFTTKSTTAPTTGGTSVWFGPWPFIALAAVMLIVGCAAAVVMLRRPKTGLDGRGATVEGHAEAGEPALDIETVEMDEPEKIQMDHPAPRQPPRAVAPAAPIPPQQAPALYARHAEAEVGGGALAPGSPAQRVSAPGTRPPAPGTVSDRSRLGAEASAEASRAPPIKFLRCSTCKTRIPIYREGPQEVVCPGCGKRGPYTPKA